MSNRKRKASAVLFGGAAVFALAIGASLDDATASAATAAASSTSSPAPSNPGGALPVQPVGGGACISGLNCGCIRHITCPWDRVRHQPVPGLEANQHAAPAPQNP